jgi:hypothetical protein
MANAVSIAVVAVLLMAFSFFADSSRAEDNCLLAPNASAPRGSSWHFHQDRLKRKCWYLRAEGQAVQERPERPAEGKVPSATTQAPHTKSDAQPLQSVQEAPAPFGGRLMQESTQDGGQAKAGPDPPSPASSSPATASTGGATASTLNETANQQQEVPATEQLSDTVKATAAEDDIQSTDRGVRKAEIPVPVLLGMGIVLAFAGIYLHDIVTMNFGRRRTVLTMNSPPDDRESAQDAALPQLAPGIPRLAFGAAATSPEVVQLLEPIAGDLAVVRRSLEQLAAEQEQMAQNIARLRAAERDIRGKTSSPPASVPLPNN